MRKLFAILFSAVSFCCLPAFGQTEQVVIRNDTLILETKGRLPLELLPKEQMETLERVHDEIAQGLRMWIEGRSIEYTGHWEIRNDSLFLTAITDGGRRNIPLDRIFGKPAPQRQVFAVWYSGEVYVCRGIYEYRTDRYEYETFYRFEHGVASGSKSVRNYIWPESRIEEENVRPPQGAWDKLWMLIERLYPESRKCRIAAATVGVTPDANGNPDRFKCNLTLIFSRQEYTEKEFSEGLAAIFRFPDKLPVYTVNGRIHTWEFLFQYQLKSEGARPDKLFPQK